MEIRKTIYVDVDEEEVLDNMSVSEIEDYLADRKKQDIEEGYEFGYDNAKDAIIDICAIKRSPVLIDKKTALETMTDLINELF